MYTLPVILNPGRLELRTIIGRSNNFNSENLFATTSDYQNQSKHHRLKPKIDHRYKHNVSGPFEKNKGKSINHRETFRRKHPELSLMTSTMKNTSTSVPHPSSNAIYCDEQSITKFMVINVTS